MEDIVVSYWGKQNKGGLKHITMPKLLVVEGDDEIKFFRTLLQQLEIKNVQICSVDGKDNFFTGLSGIMATRNFDTEIQVMAIIRDADSNPSSAFESITGTLKRAIEKIGLDDILTESPTTLGSYTSSTPKIGVYILPDGSSEGMLEDLCLRTVQNSPILTCVEKFMTCIPQQPENLSKAKVKAFLSAMPKPGLPLAGC